MEHVAQYRANNPGISYKQSLTDAKASYTPNAPNAPSKPRGKARGKAPATRSMKGEGIRSTLETIGSTVNTAARSVVGLVADKRLNTLLPGENHGLLQIPGQIQPAWARFLGPGTSSSRMLTQEGLTPVDQLAHRHDLASATARNQRELNASDDHFLKRLPFLRDTIANKAQASVLALRRIASVAGVNIGSSFGDPLLEKNPALRAQYDAKIKQLTQQGFGPARRGAQKTRKR